VLTVGVAVGCTLFWMVRLRYWREIHEEPFSDMADYLAIADAFRCCWSLAQSDFWASYAKPTLPALAGFLFSATGGIDLDMWRGSLALLTLGSLLFLAREVYACTRDPLYPVALILCVALSKSSIFWSYKFATEGLGEALIYLVSAALLYVFRSKDTASAAIFLGIISTLALFNRPNLILVMPLIALGLAMRISWRRRSCRLRPRNLLGFTIGCACIVVPLALRSYSLYGTLNLSPTQGPYSFLWELGAVPVTTPAGESTTRTAQQLQEDAPRYFESDLEASRYAQGIVKEWVAANWNDLYPRLIRNRFYSSIEQRDIALSRVPRARLFSGRLERILLDKSLVIFLLGSLGLVLLAIHFGGASYILSVTAILPWAFGLFFMGDPRMLEPSLPLILFGFAALAVLVVRWGCWALVNLFTRISANRPRHS